jgi:hypothetical protein
MLFQRCESVGMAARVAELHLPYARGELLDCCPGLAADQSKAGPVVQWNDAIQASDCTQGGSEPLGRRI